MIQWLDLSVARSLEPNDETACGWETTNDVTLMKTLNRSEVFHSDMYVFSSGCRQSQKGLPPCSI